MEYNFSNTITIDTKEYFHYAGYYKRIHGVTSEITEGEIEGWYLRQEGNKVYSWMSGTNQEILMYDFDLKPGDTIVMQVSSCTNNKKYILDSLSEIEFEGRILSSQHFSLHNTDTLENRDFYVVENLINIETIGNINLGFNYLLDPGFCLIDFFPNTFRCYRKAESIFNPFLIDCESIRLISSISDVVTQKAKLYPNPARNVINFETIAENELKYEIYDSRGRLVQSGNIIQAQIVIDSLPTGVYYIAFKAKSGFIFSQSFVKI